MSADFLYSYKIQQKNSVHPQNSRDQRSFLCTLPITKTAELIIFWSKNETAPLRANDQTAVNNHVRAVCPTIFYTPIRYSKKRVSTSKIAETDALFLYALPITKTAELIIFWSKNRAAPLRAKRPNSCQ